MPSGFEPQVLRDHAPKEMVPKVGFEPTRVLAQRCLRPPRLPFRHFGLDEHDTVSVSLGRSWQRLRMGWLWLQTI